MTNQECTHTTSELRHKVTCVVVHGFHHSMCNRQSFDSTTKTLSVGCVKIPVDVSVLSCKSGKKTLCELGQENSLSITHQQMHQYIIY